MSVAYSLSRTRRYWREALHVFRRQFECTAIVNLPYQAVVPVAQAALRNGSLAIATALFTHDMSSKHRYLPEHETQAPSNKSLGSSIANGTDSTVELLGAFFAGLSVSSSSSNSNDVQQQIGQLKLFLQLLNFFYHRFSDASLNALVSHLRSLFPSPNFEVQFSKDTRYLL